MHAHARSFAAFALAAITLATALASPAHAERRQLQRIRSGDEQPPAGSHHLTSPWGGGASSLPYNIDGLTEQQLRDHALGMAGVVAAMNAFQSRGYIRRADLDTFFVGVGYSGLVLGYEKPGVPVMTKQPVILVQSQAIQFPGEGWFPATTIGGAVMRDTMIQDSIRVPTVDRDPADPPMLVYQQMAQAPGSQAEGEGIYAFYAYSMKECYEWQQALRQYLPSQSPQAAQWWYGLCNEINQGATTGMIMGGFGGAMVGGFAGIPPGMAYGLIHGSVNAGVSYAAKNPFPRPTTP